MNSDEIDAICKKITRTNSHDEIDELLDKTPEKDLYDLAKKLLESPFLFDYALVSVLSRLFDDEAEFAELLCNFFEATCYDMACGTLYEPLKEKIVSKHDKSYSLVNPP